MLENYTLYGDRLLVSSKEVKDEKTAGGLIIPSSNKEDTLLTELTIVKVSKSLEETFKVGNNVLVFKNRGTPVTLEGKDYRLLEKGEVLIIKRG